MSLKYSKIKILKPYLNRHEGYRHVILQAIDGKSYSIKIHRLVAIAFILNTSPRNKTHVNHIDENKEHNYFQNIEWVNPKENVNYGTRNFRAKKSISKSNKHNPKLMGKNNWKAKSISYYETNPTLRPNFKTACKRQGCLMNLKKFLRGIISVQMALDVINNIFID